jgi:hypothetical protein
MFREYMLVDRKPVLVGDALEFEGWFLEADRRVATTEVLGIVVVSTVFLGFDHRTSGSGPPVLFESMAFWEGEPHEQQRCCTWEQAETMHQDMVHQVSQPRAVLGWFRRVWRESVDEARRDWRESMEDIDGVPKERRRPFSLPRYGEDA